MVDSVSQVTSGAAALAEASAPLARATPPLNPADTQSFSLLMEGKIPDAVYTKPISAHPSELQQAIAKKGVELSQNVQSIEQEGQALMGGNFSDPLLQMKVMSEFSYRAASTFAHLHLTSSLVSAANNSFQSLFKNQG